VVNKYCCQLLENVMSDRFEGASAEGYDRGFGSVSAQFIPTLLSSARVSPGQRVLDVATGTGIAAKAAVVAVGPTGHVIATDLSSPMLQQARERLGATPNAAFAVGNGQSLAFPDQSFDAVLCAMGLMFFTEPARGLSEFHRTVREGGWAAVSVNTTPEKAFVTRVDAVIARHAGSHPAAHRYFSLGNASLLRSLFAAAGFRNIGTTTETRRFPFASFSAYFSPIEKGQGPTGRSFVALTATQQDAVREEIRRQLENAPVPGGPINVEVEILFGFGQR
jgi:ubiquinone/menaquinone biosynthesis C-methylase UbiE